MESDNLIKVENAPRCRPQFSGVSRAVIMRINAGLSAWRLIRFYRQNPSPRRRRGGAKADDSSSPGDAISDTFYFLMKAVIS